ncbi:MAG TPA: carbon storage regulator [Noviherbaspirillum sp.]|nr:carbon storage regulator [Noviherbaspirillum sp.]
MLKLDIRVGESIAIGSLATITLEHKSGQIARLAIHADKSIPVQRVQTASTAQIAAEGGITGKR